MPRFIDNIDAVVAKIGTENVGLVWGLANVNWDSDVERDDFLNTITTPQGA
jgi:hypothetical protein